MTAARYLPIAAQGRQVCGTCEHWGPEQHERGRECRHESWKTHGWRLRKSTDFCSGHRQWDGEVVYSDDCWLNGDLIVRGAEIVVR